MGEGVVANLQRSRGRGQSIFIYAPTFIIDQKLGGGGGSSKSLKKYRAWPKHFHLCPHFYNR